MIEQLKNHWEQLQARERRILLGGAVALVLLALYGLVWDPYLARIDSLERQVAEQRALLTWMEGAAAEVKTLRARQPAGRSGQSPMALVDSSARNQGLAQALKRVQPDGANTVRVWLEQADFDELVRWLDKLVAENGMRISGLVVDKRPESGRVDARITLESGV